MNTIDKTLKSEKTVENVRDFQNKIINNLNTFCAKKKFLTNIKENLYKTEYFEFYQDLPTNSEIILFNKNSNWIINVYLLLLFTIFPFLRFSNKTFYEKILNKRREKW